jgi:uncharacterized SAM-binding protein YcdF (DUF218 family)
MSTSQQQIAQIAEDLNALARYLALDDFGRAPLTNDDLRSVDVVVLFGNQVVATLVRACSLAQQAPGALLLFSGGVGHATRALYENLCAESGLIANRHVSSTMTEAEMYSAIAESAFGIPAQRILVESRSSNSGENARFTICILKDLGFGPGTILLLQDPTMQRRAVLTWQREAQVAGIYSNLLSHPTLVPCVETALDGTLRIRPDQAAGSWSLARLVSILMGEIRRLRDDENGYGPRGRNFITHVDIPEPILESYARLTASDLIRGLEQSGERRP